MKVELLAVTPDPINIMYLAAKTCYSDKPTMDIEIKEPLKLVRQVLESGHHSIAEHVHFTFAISGISRACSHQLVRHRHCTFSQQSQRYVGLTEQEFVVPRQLEKDNYDEIGKTLNIIWASYQTLIENGVKKEDARCILPNCTSTNLVMTCNLRQLIHMCDLRLCTRAQTEIRQLFQEIKQEVFYVNPDIAYMLQPQCEHLGYCPEHNSCGRKKER